MLLTSLSLGTPDLFNLSALGRETTSLLEGDSLLGSQALLTLKAGQTSKNPVNCFGIPV